MSKQNQVEGAPTMIDPAVLRKYHAQIEHAINTPIGGALASYELQDRIEKLFDVAIQEQEQSLRAALVQELDKLVEQWRVIAKDDFETAQILEMGSFARGSLNSHGDLLTKCADEVAKLLTGDARHGQEQG